MKRAILTLVLAVAAMMAMGQGKVVWEDLMKSYSPNPQLEINKVELTPERTTLYASYNNPPNSWFLISRESYLESDGKKYAIIGSDSITLGEKHYTDEETWTKEFVLYFKPLPLDTKVFDFMEGTAPNDFKVFDIHEKSYTMPVTPVPEEYLANYAEDDVMEELKYSDEPATIHFKAMNYRKGMNTEVQVQYVDLKNPANPVDAKVYLDDNGEATLRLPICFPQAVWPMIYNIPWASRCALYLAPGKEVTVLIDMLHDDSKANSKFVGFKGYFAKFDREWYPLALDCEKAFEEVERPKWNEIHDVATLMKAINKETDDCLEILKRLSCSKTWMDYMVAFLYNPPLFPHNVVADSLLNSKEFTDFVLQNYTRNLYSSTAVFDNGFVDNSKYYVKATNARGINADLARYCYYLPQVLQGKDIAKPLIEDKALSDLYDKYAEEYRSGIASNKEGFADQANVHYLDMTEVEPKDVLPTLLERYKGKVVMIDIWATWCVPCRYGIEQMEPLKKELADKDIVYIYITSSTSPVNTWKELIPTIGGEQYYLTDEQCYFILEQHESNGYPTYAIYDKNGNQTFKTIGFPGVETIKAELEKAIQ